MLDNIIDKNIIFLRNHGIKIDSDDGKAIYKYGLQILYYYLIDLFVIFTLTYIFGRLYETAIVTFIFALLQLFGGGYHAKTPLKCLITMIIGAVTGNILIMIIADKIVFNIVLAVIFSGAILKFTPVINKRHPVGQKTKHRSKLIVRAAVILILTAICILSYLNGNIEVAAMTVTIGLYLTSLLYAKIKTIT